MIEITKLKPNIFDIKNTNYSNEIVDVKAPSVSISNYYSYLLKLKEDNLHSIAFNLDTESIEKAIKHTKACKNAYNRFLDNFYDYEIKVLLCTENKEVYNECYKVIEEEYPVEDILKYNGIENNENE